MNMTGKIWNLWIMAAVGLTVWAPSAEALDNGGGYTISDLTVRQRWPWSRKVDIDFYLAKPEEVSSSQAVAIGLVASNGVDAVTISDASLYGDYDYMLPEGYRRIVWDPTIDHSGKSFSQLKFFLSVTATNIVPSYMVVDLVSGAAEYKGLSFAAEVNTDVYKTDKLALRYIPEGSFIMGEGAKTQTVTLTKSFYAGVFEVTQRQWELVMGIGTKPSYFTSDYAARPLEQRSYEDIRGASNNLPSSVNWPGTGSGVLLASFVGLLRAKTGLTDFDLPTEAQWEYLCRSGTQTYYSDGVAGTPNGTSNVQMDVLGRYKYDGGYLADGVTAPAQSCGPTNGTAVVGSYQANAWGLYDTHGNVWEWCLDWYTNSLGTASVTDPAGAVSGSHRVFRGGSWLDAASTCRSTYRNFDSPSYWSRSRGFRLVRTLP